MLHQNIPNTRSKYSQPDKKAAEAIYRKLLVATKY